MAIHAVRIHDYGGPEVMRWEPIAEPVPEPGEVLVRVRANGVNPVDWKTRQGMRRGRGDLPMPAILGCDLCGVVEQAGADVTSVAPGDEVYGMTGLHGAFAEMVCLDAAKVAPKPPILDFIHAAAVPLAALTAWQALQMAGLRAGQRILVHAGAGGVGGFTVQMAWALGAEVVATASAAKAGYVASLGADQVVDYTATPFETAVAPVDVVLDLLGGEVQDRSWQVLKPGGFLVTAVALGDTARPEGARAARVGVRSDGAQLRTITQMIEAGQIRVHVDRTLPLSQAAEAVELCARGRTQGKIVLVA